MTPEPVRLSKLLSQWLRHKPEAGGLQLDPQGWTQVDAVLAALGRSGIACDRKALLAIVVQSDKQRFALSNDAVHIRAQQGHSMSICRRMSRRRGKSARGAAPPSF